jgi:hypothetical protein
VRPVLRPSAPCFLAIFCGKAIRSQRGRGTGPLAARAAGRRLLHAIFWSDRAQTTRIRGGRFSAPTAPFLKRFSLSTLLRDMRTDQVLFGWTDWRCLRIRRQAPCGGATRRAGRKIPICRSRQAGIADHAKTLRDRHGDTARGYKSCFCAHGPWRRSSNGGNRCIHTARARWQRFKYFP